METVAKIQDVIDDFKTEISDKNYLDISNALLEVNKTIRTLHNLNEILKSDYISLQQKMYFSVHRYSKILRRSNASTMFYKKQVSDLAGVIKRLTNTQCMNKVHCECGMDIATPQMTSHLKGKKHARLLVMREEGS